MIDQVVGGSLVNGAARIDWAERVAVGASVACLAHCLALPLMIALMPALSSILSLSESFHLWLLGLAVPMALIALVQGRGRHGRTGPLTVGIAGLVLLGAGALVFGRSPWETPVTVAGSLALVAAHVANWRLRHACR